MSTRRSNVRPMLLGFILILAVFGVGLLILVISETPVTKPQEIVVATGSWPPYIVENPDSQAGAREHGPLAAFATEMFRLAGYKIKKLEFDNWENALDRVASADDEVVAAFPYAYEADIPDVNRKEGSAAKKAELAKGNRSDRFWFTESFFPFAHVLYFNRKKIEVADLVRWAESPDPEKRYRLGRVSGYALWPKIVHSVQSISEPYPDIESAFQALRDEKIELLPESPHVGSMILQAMHPEERKKFGRYWSPEGVMAGSALTLHVLTARNRTGLQLRNQLNAAIATLARQGRLAALKSEFFDEDDPERKRTPARIRGMTVVRESCEGEKPCKRFVLAQGTSAVVLIWPRFLEESSSAEAPPDDAGKQEYLVKIKSGPHANRLVYVPVSALELNAQGE